MPEHGMIPTAPKSHTLAHHLSQHDAAIQAFDKVFWAGMSVALVVGVAATTLAYLGAFSDPDRFEKFAHAMNSIHFGAGP